MILYKKRYSQKNVQVLERNYQDFQKFQLFPPPLKLDLCLFLHQQLCLFPLVYILASFRE